MTSPTTRRPAALLGWLLALAGALVLMTAGPAAAHDVLISTSPADGSGIGATPAQVVLTFDQPAIKIGTILKVTGPAGDVTDGTATLVDNQVRQAITPGAPAGRYTVAWRVTSADGHPVSGTFTFTSSKPGAGHASATKVPLAASGGTVTGTPGAPRRWPWILAVLLLAAAVGGVLLTSTRRRHQAGPS